MFQDTITSSITSSMRSRPEGWAQVSQLRRGTLAGRSKYVPSRWISMCEWTGDRSSSEWLEQRL